MSFHGLYSIYVAYGHFSKIWSLVGGPLLFGVPPKGPIMCRTDHVEFRACCFQNLRLDPKP